MNRLWYYDPTALKAVSNDERRADLADQMARLEQFGVLRPLEPVGQMDVHPNGVKAINCDLDPGLYWLIPMEADDES